MQLVLLSRLANAKLQTDGTAYTSQSVAVGSPAGLSSHCLPNSTATPFVAQKGERLEYLTNCQLPKRTLSISLVNDFNVHGTVYR
jgi:hypothetical protein